MKITDLRCGRELIGEYVETIPGGSQPSDEQLNRYLGVRPGDTQYEQHRRPTTHKRIVLEHAVGKFYVVTVNKKFYKVEP